MPLRHGAGFIVNVSGIELNSPADMRLVRFDFTELEEGGKVLEFTIPDEKLELIDSPAFIEGNSVKWRYGYPPGEFSPLYKGKIGEVNPTFDGEGITLTIKVFDPIIDVLTQKASKIYKKDGLKGITHSEVIQLVAADLGLTAAIEPTRDYQRSFNQANESYYSFIERLSRKAVTLNPAKRGKYHLNFSADGKKLIWKPVPLARPRKRIFTYYLEKEDMSFISFSPKSKPFDPEKLGAEQTSTSDISAKDGSTINEVTDNSTATNRNVAGASRVSLAKNKVEGYVGRGHQNPAGEDPRSTVEQTTAEAENTLHQDELDAVEGTLEVLLDETLRRGDVIEIRNVGKKFSGFYMIAENRVVIDEEGAKNILELKRNAASKDAALANTPAQGRTSGDDPSPEESQQYNLSDSSPVNSGG